MISLVICSVDDKRFGRTEEMYRRLLGGKLLDLVRISDARSIAEGYNRGVERTRGDVVFFSHDDVEFLAPDFVLRVESHLNVLDIVGVAGTSRLIGPKWTAAGVPYLFGQIAGPRPKGGGYGVAIFGTPARAVGGMQALDGLFLATKRRVFQRVQFDASVFDGFHLYDIDFTFSAYLEGFRLGVANDLFPVHASSGTYDDVWKTFAVRFCRKRGRLLTRMKSRRQRWAVVNVDTKEEAAEVMSGGRWDIEPHRPAAYYHFSEARIGDFEDAEVCV